MLDQEHNFNNSVKLHFNEIYLHAQEKKKRAQ